MVTAREIATTLLLYGWDLLPPAKWQALVTDVVFRDLGAHHGAYRPQDGVITLNVRLFTPPVHALPTYDALGQSPAATTPWVFRGLATWVHEVAHAIGHATGLDRSAAWLSLSGWASDAVHPHGALDASRRYVERRPGWAYEISPWSHARTAWFPRDYSRKSPQEDFADCLTYHALGWDDCFARPAGGDPAVGARKLAYLRDHLDGLQASAAVRPAAAAWRRTLQRLVADRQKV